MITQKVQLLSTEFQPMNEFILVNPVEFPREEITPAGVIVQFNQKSTDRPTSGEVIAVGGEANDDEISAGTFVLWPNTDGLDIEFIDGVFILLRYKSIIGSRKAK